MVEGNNVPIVFLLSVQGCCHNLDPVGSLSQGTPWKYLHDCDVGECSGVDELVLVRSCSHCAASCKIMHH